MVPHVIVIVYFYSCYSLFLTRFLWFPTTDFLDIHNSAIMSDDVNSISDDDEQSLLLVGLLKFKQNQLLGYRDSHVSHPYKIIVGSVLKGREKDKCPKKSGSKTSWP